MADDKSKSREEIIRQDMQDLHKLGYAQQLFREMGGFSNFGHGSVSEQGTFTIE